MLAQVELDQFIAEGYVVLRGAFSPAVASECRAYIWKCLGLSPDDPAAWHQRMIHVRELFSDGPFAHVMTEGLFAALDELMGRGRAVIHDRFGWWPILFPGFKGRGGWHVDGDDFRHHVTSPEQGLVPIFFFSSVEPGDGGTAIVPGSHRPVARLLADAEPGGLAPPALRRRLARLDLARTMELSAEAGDVAMLHPFLVHGSSDNTGPRVRFACNPRYSLRAPMCLRRADGAYSPVEEAIRDAL